MAFARHGASGTAVPAGGLALLFVAGEHGDGPCDQREDDCTHNYRKPVFRDPFEHIERLLFVRVSVNALPERTFQPVPQSIFFAQALRRKK